MGSFVRKGPDEGGVCSSYRDEMKMSFGAYRRWVLMEVDGGSFQKLSGGGMLINWELVSRDGKLPRVTESVAGSPWSRDCFIRSLPHFI